MNKFLCFLIIFCLVISVFIGITRVLNDPMRNLVEYKYTVSQGDTLWDIASQYCPASMDKQAYISRVREANNLSTCMIYPGQVITIYR